MAKHKPSVALFEVIHAAKAKQQQHQKSPAKLLSTPNWWFKGKNDHLAEQAAETFAAGEVGPRQADLDAPTVAPIGESSPTQPLEPQRDVFAFDAAQTHAEPHVDVPAAPPASRKLRTPFDAPAHEEERVEEVNPFALFKKSKFSPPAPSPAVPVALPAPQSVAPTASAGAAPARSPLSISPTPAADAFDGLIFTDPEPAARSGRAVKVDRDNQHVTLNLSYTAAIIAGAAVLVIVALAFILGRDSRKPALATNANDRVQLSAARPDVLTNLRPGSADRAAPVNNAPKVAPAGGSNARISGQQYVIIESYETRPQADQAIAFLSKRGIEATVERGMKQTGNPNWFNVVGAQGFQRTSGDDYKSYMARIRALGGEAKTQKLKDFSQTLTFRQD